jgi:hypothetical protein
VLKKQSLLSNGEIETPMVLVAHPQFLLSPEQVVVLAQSSLHFKYPDKLRRNNPNSVLAITGERL